MTDKISSINGPINGSNIQKTNNGVSGSSASNNLGKGESLNKISSDQVDISSAQALENIREGLASQPVVDRQKVESVKQALQDGSYKINSENIVAKLIEFDNLLK